MGQIAARGQTRVIAVRDPRSYISINGYNGVAIEQGKSALFKEPPIKSAGILQLDKVASKLLNAEGKWRTVQFKVDSDWSNVRLDRLLTKKFDISSSLAQKLIRTRKVWIERDSQKFYQFRIYDWKLAIRSIYLKSFTGST